MLWNEPSAGAGVDHYVIELSMDMGTTWESPTTDAKESDSSNTAYTDPRHYVAGETLGLPRCGRERCRHERLGQGLLPA